MNQSVLERDLLKAFDKTHNPDIIKHNLNDLDNDFEYLFQTFSLLVHDVGQEITNNLSANINRNQQQRDIPNENMSILDHLLAKAAIQDIINADSNKTAQTFFHTLFNTESMANFYVIGFSSLLT